MALENKVLKDLLITQEDRKNLIKIINKRAGLQELLSEYSKRFGKLGGSVFDGGFYTVFNKDAMTSKELKEFELITESLEYLSYTFRNYGIGR